MMRLIILPQALKIVIPGIVNSFIGLFKDTSLVLIIGIFDLLGIVQRNFTDANWASPTDAGDGLRLRRRRLLGVLFRHVALFACTPSAGSTPATSAERRELRCMTIEPTAASVDRRKMTVSAPTSPSR